MNLLNLDAPLHHSFDYGVLQTYFEIHKAGGVEVGQFCGDTWISFHRNRGAVRDLLIVNGTHIPPQRKPVERVVSLKKVRGAAKTREVVTDVIRALDPSQYDSEQRRRLFKVPAKNPTYTARRAQDDDFDSILEALKKWAAAKLDDPRVHKMTFTPGRYRRCVEAAQSGDRRFSCYALLLDGVVVGAEVVSLNGVNAYCLASFATCPFAARFSISMLKLLHEDGAAFYNRGDSMNARLLHHKTQWPYHETHVYSFVRTVDSELQMASS